jgi:hypothetical protein
LSFPSRMLYLFVIAHVRATHPAHLTFIWFPYKHLMKSAVQIMNTLIFQFSPSRYTLLLRPKYSPQQSVLKRLNLCASSNVQDQVSHPYTATVSVTGLYILILTFLLHNVQVGCGAHPASYTMDRGRYFPRDNAAGT